MPPAQGQKNKARNGATENTLKARAKKFEHLDAAATALTRILRRLDINHMFVGGYAASVLGGERVTEDVDVIVTKQCRDYIVKQPNFRLSTDNRLIFCHNGTDVLIDVAHFDQDYGKDNFKTFPEPTRRRLIQVDIPERRFELPLPVLHPRILLLTKLAPWKESYFSTRSDAKMRSNTDLQDIIVLLEWLRDRGLKVDFDTANVKGKNTFVQALGHLFVQVEEARPLVAGVLDPFVLCDAINKAKP
ncbi:hypothetical protein N7466_010023 [Penicillium verhagenii]|uniref:uncharacterized protein n=1 Tax=Penicillium verhagenii TaxID=1562060 RepID=UPI0025457DBE|nr:uncharacterized protein N7466_010023 [Penicillium verhagenii]KAJ5919080.1 hypothetical protein N7466_010023 [Penicillium verhagenii]